MKYKPEDLQSVVDDVATEIYLDGGLQMEEFYLLIEALKTNKSVNSLTLHLNYSWLCKIVDELKCNKTITKLELIEELYQKTFTEPMDEFFDALKNNNI